MPPSTSRHHRRHGPTSKVVAAETERLITEAQRSQQSGSLQRALNLCEKALALNPSSIEALCAYGLLAIRAGRPEVSLEVADLAARLDPTSVKAQHCAGVARRHCGRVQDAIASLGRAIEIQPDHVDSLTEMVFAFIDAGDLSTAEVFLAKVLEIDAHSAPVQSALGRMYASTGRIDDAIAAHQRAIALDPGNAEALNFLADVLRDAGDLDASISTYRQSIGVAPQLPSTWSSLLLTSLCSDRFSARENAEFHRQYGTYFAKILRPMPASRTTPFRGRRLRIGYLSANFRRHAVVKFFQPLVAEHDRSRFEIFCYYNGAAGDNITQQIIERVEHFSPVWGIGDGALAAQIRRDGIDILIDLDGHTHANRLQVFFLKPAPIQVTWLGYLSTTGISAIDYRLTDHKADPPGLSDEYHVEKLWRLPRTAWCYTPYAEAPAIVQPPCEMNKFVTFGCLNSPHKLTPPILQLWAKILLGVPLSRLILHVSPRTSRQAELLEFFSANGIAVERISLVGRLPIDQYLAAYNSVDIALDTWPCSGGTTTCDALWMGVSVVTLAGELSFSRTGASILGNLGLGDLVVNTFTEYAARAIALAHNFPRIAQLRSSLRRQMQSSFLMDEVGFARDIEAAFLGMSERHAAS
jgi:protein O-GlcNAc transferase